MLVSFDVLHRSARQVFRRSLRLLPKNRFGDFVFSLLMFLRVHKRLPKNEPLSNDVLFKIKTSNEIFDPFRVLVSDKELLKSYVKDVVGDQYNLATYAILRLKESVRLYDFPDRCIIKPTHSSGKVIFRLGDSSFNLNEIEDWFESLPLY